VTTAAPTCPTVEHLDVSTYVVPLDEPESDGTFTWTSTTVVVVELRANDGTTGIGWTYATPACAPLVRDVLHPAVAGVGALDPPRMWREMVAAIRNVGRAGIASMAIAAVDIAAWDLKGKLLDLPLCRLLGMSHDRVAAYGSGGFTSLTDGELRDQLGGWAADGFSMVKMKVGTAWGGRLDRDLHRAEVARDAIGDDVQLFVDANGGYRRKEAVRAARRFGDLGVTWFEEPVSSDDLEGLAEVRALVDLDVAAGEYGYDLTYFGRMCAAGAVDVVQADVSRCAGITEWLRVAAVAAAHGLEISAHCAPALHLHPAVCAPNIRHLEWFADHVRVDGLLFDGAPTPTVEGHLAPDLSRPGHGMALKRPDAERWRIDA
jgi:L-alanine-DL-glutamate epimerase-like enolase superfamily enzyme